MWLPPCFALKIEPLAALLRLGFVFSLLLTSVFAKEHWTELNIGPFSVITDTDPVRAREDLTQLEQLRWVLGNLLETKDLTSIWPIRIILTGKDEETKAASSEFVLQSGQYLTLMPSNAPPPLSAVAGLLLSANTPRLPPDVESGLRQLFSTLQAHGSRVTWGSAPPHPDLAWARMQLLATKFEYGASLHIFMAALKDGSTLETAERNAFAKSTTELETEARANLAGGHWTAVPVSGRPLDPKRDFGEHTLDPALAELYLADWGISSDLRRSDDAYHAAVAAGGSLAPLGYEGLAAVALASGDDPRPAWEAAIRAGSRSAPVYVSSADGLAGTEALPYLKKAARLNDRWGEPVLLQAQFASTPAEKEALLKAGLKLDPRATKYWIELAKVQTEAGEGTAAQGSWLRAENSAADDAERAKIHQAAQDSEQQRLNAAEAARRRERESVHLADEQAQQAESDRIRAAEEKANQALDNAAGGDAPSGVVDWNSLGGQKKLNGMLTRVDCLKHGWRLSVKDKTGHSTLLFLPQETAAQLTCGTQTRPRKVSLEYRAMLDDTMQTTGEVTLLQLQ